MTFRLPEQPVKHRAERRDPGSGGDEYGVAERRTQGEIPERPLKRYSFARSCIAEMVRHKSVLHAVEAEGDASVFRWRRGDGICAGNFFSLRRVDFHGEPLSG